MGTVRLQRVKQTKQIPGKKVRSQIVTQATIVMCRIDLIYGNIFMNRVDPDQTALKEQSELGLHCLQFRWVFLTSRLIHVILCKILG